MRTIVRLLAIAGVATTCATAQIGTTTLWQATLDAPATAPLGGVLTFQLGATPGPAVYVLEASITGTSPGTPVPGGVVPLNPPLLFTTFGGAAPGVFQGFGGGVTDAAGFATASIALPSAPTLGGVIVAAAFVVIDPATGAAVVAISNATQTTLVGAAPVLITSIVPPVAVQGQTVTVNGSGFGPGLFASISGFPVVAMAITTTSFTFTMPAGTYCDAPLVVAMPGGQSDFQQFSPGPAIISVIGPPGAPTGGTPVTVNGLDFHGGTTLAIGGAPATIVAMTTTSIDAIAPPGASGPVALVVTSAAGCPAVAAYAYQ